MVIQYVRTLDGMKCSWIKYEKGICKVKFKFPFWMTKLTDRHRTHALLKKFCRCFAHATVSDLVKTIAVLALVAH